MNKLIILTFVLCLVGCSTTAPVVVKFPEAPKLMSEKCPQLKTIDNDNASIVDLTKIVTENYTTYYECAVRQDAWIEWYQIQKKIFEGIK